MNAVTGAFGYTGKYIARRLLAHGERVITLTGHPDRPNEFAGAIAAYPFRFEEPEGMAASLRGVRILYNTYWVRFDRGDTTHERAVANTRALVRAAELAGVERIVHIGITNPDPASSLPYFRGKARVEEAIRESRLTWAIVRPTVIFGPEDILINNIAYLLRRMPLFLVPGDGSYRLQPVAAEDVAAIAVEAGGAAGNVTTDAVGPEVFTFEELVRRIGAAVGGRARILHAPPGAALLAARVLGTLWGDVVLTADELAGLTANLLVSSGEPTGSTRLSGWIATHADTLGTHYSSELRRHFAG